MFYFDLKREYIFRSISEGPYRGVETGHVGSRSIREKKNHRGATGGRVWSGVQCQGPKTDPLEG